MRLLFWSELFRPDIGGVEIWSAQLIHALQARGHACMAVACQGPSPMPEQSTFEGIPVHRFSFHAALLRRDLGAIKKLVAQIVAVKREFAPDVIHINSSQPSVLFHEKSAAASACATLVTVHEPPMLHAGDSMLARLLRRADWVVGISQAMLDDALRLVPEIAAKSSVIHNAIDDEPARASPLDYEASDLLCVARLVKEKGLDIAIRALADVRDIYPHVRMTIAGDGPERSNLESLVAQLGVAEAIRFAGWVTPPEVSQLLRRALMVVIPSRWREPFGLVALEAAEAGRPVIASRVGGLPEVVIDRITGILVPPDDSRALATAIRELMANPAGASVMGAAARRHKLSKFDYGEFVESYEQLYRQLGGGGGPRALGG